MLKKIFDLQKAILNATKKRIEGKGRPSEYIIEESEGYVYVSEHGQNLHRIYSGNWFLDNENIPFFRPGNGLSKCTGENPDQRGEFTGVKLESEFRGKKRTLVEIRGESGEKIYVNEKLLKYVDFEHCYIKCSTPIKPVFFIDSQLYEIVAMVCPVNPNTI